MSRGSPIRHAGTTPIIGGSYHIIQCESFHTFRFPADSYCRVLCRCCEHAKLAYELLWEAAHKRTEHLVIEAGVDTEFVIKSVLPWELVLLLQQSLDVVDIEEDPGSVSRIRYCQSDSCLAG